MTTAVANKAGTAMAMIQSLKAGIANVLKTLVKKAGDPYMRFLRDGSWVYGQDDTDVQAGSLWALNPMSIQHGWVAWKRGEGVDNSGGPLGQVMTSAMEAMPSQLDLPELSDKTAQWAQQFAVSMLCMTGEDKGTQTLWKTNSTGGVDAFDKLLKAIGIQLDADPSKPVPVVQLTEDSYPHKKYGKTYTPVLKIVQWIALSEDMPDLGVGEEAQEAAAEPEKPVKTAAAAKKPRKASVPAVKAETAATDEDDEIAQLEARIAAKAAAKQAAAAPVESAADKRKRELREQLAALEDSDETDAEETPAADPAPAAAAGEPIRRRRPAA